MPTGWCPAIVADFELDLEVSHAHILATSDLSRSSLLADQWSIERLHDSLALPSTPVSHRVAAGDAVARRSRRLTQEPGSRLPADEVPGFEKAGPGSEFVDRSLDIPGGGTVLGFIE